MPHQIAVTVRAPLKEGRGPEVAALLETLRKDVAQDGGPFAGMPGVHFARLFVLPGDAELDVPRHAGLPRGGRRPAARATSTTCWRHDRLAALFAQCADFPERGVRADRLRWARRHRVAPAAWYVHRVGRSAQQVRDEARLRAAIVDFLDGHDRSGMAIHGRCTTPSRSSSAADRTWPGR